MSWSPEAFKPCRLIWERLLSMRDRRKLHRLPSGMAPAICLAGLWPTKEVRHPVLLLPHTRISSPPRTAFNSLLPRRRPHRRAPLEDTRRALL